MCKQIGVDPLSSNKGFWVDVLGVGDFYYELAVSIIVHRCLTNYVIDSNCKHLHRPAQEKRRLLGRVRLLCFAKASKSEHAHARGDYEGHAQSSKFNQQAGQ